MCNLYARLVKGEDARTEALADLLERMLAGDREGNTYRFADFVSDVLLADPTANQEKENFLQGPIRNSADITVETQFQIPDGKKPDMVIFNGAEPLCVVEVKVDADVADGQLEGYGRWLAQNAGEGNTPALVLLMRDTHQAPQTFLDPGADAFGVQLRSIVSWNEVAEWFSTVSAVRVDEPLRSLAREFGEFLKEDGMATLDDAAIARQYLASSERKLTQAVENMRANFPFPEHWTGRHILEKKRVGICKWLYLDEDKTSYLYYGLGFKPVDKEDGALYGFARYENAAIDNPTRVAIGDGFYAFVCIYAPANACRRVPGFNENRWYTRHDGELVQAENGLVVDSMDWWHCLGPDKGAYARISPLQELLDHDGHLGARLRDWAHDALGKSVSLWNALIGEDG